MSDYIVRNTMALQSIIQVPDMDKLSHAQQSVGLNYLSIPKLQRLLYRWSLGMEVISSHTL